MEEAKYEELVGMLTKMKVALTDNGEYRSTYDIMKDIAAQWDKMSSMDQAALATALSGTRQQAVFYSIIEQFQEASGAMDKMANSAGALDDAYAVYMESASAHINQFKAAFEGLSSNLMRPEIVNPIIDVAKALVNILNGVVSVTNSLGGLNTVLVVTAALVATINADALWQGISKIGSAIVNIIPSIKAFTVSMTAAQAATGWFALIGAAIYGVVKAFDYFSKARERAEQKAADSLSAFKQAESEAESLSNRIRDVSERLSELQNLSKSGKITLTEKDELDKLSKECEQLEIRKKLLEETAALRRDEAKQDAVEAFSTKKDYRGTSNVDAIIADAANRANEEYAEYMRATLDYTFEYANEQYEEYLDKRSKIEDDYSISVEERAAALDELAESYAGVIDAYNMYARYDTDDLTVSAHDLIYSEVGALSDAFSEVDTYEKYANLLIKKYNELQDVINGGGELTDGQLILFNDLRAAIVDVFSDIDKYKQDYGDGPWDVIYDGIMRTLYPIEYFNQQMSQMPEGLTQVIESAKNAGGITAEVVAGLAQNYPAFKALLDVMTNAGFKVDSIVNSLNTASNAANNFAVDVAPKSLQAVMDSVSDMADGLKALNKVYKDISDGGAFDFTNVFSKDFTEQFGSLGESYDTFMETIANSPKDITKCRDAFDDLVSAYVRQSGVLDGLTESTKSVVVAMLEQQGIANASEIVDAALAYQKEKLRIETELGADATYDDVKALYDEAAAGSLTKQVLAQLAAEKMLANQTSIKTSADIANLISLANAANATAASLVRLRQVESLMSQATTLGAVGNGMSFEEQYDRLKRAEELRKQAQDLLNKGIEFNSFDISGYIGDVGGGGGSSKSDSDNWFKEQYKIHQHLVEMIQEDDYDYLTWLDDAYKRAYAEGIITLDDYYKYQSEVFKGLQDLFKDYLNDIEHEISMREAFDGENAKIIELYKQMIAAVEKEIAAARERGMDDTDDYIQELQDKWVSYRDAIKDLQDGIKDDAKSAAEKLIDIRVDMLKQDINNEKDAIKKKLDYLKEFYQKQKDLLKEVYDEEKYLEEQAEKRKKIADIQAQLSQLQNDDSAWAQKRRKELEQQLAEAQKELDDFERDHALEAAQDELDRLLELQEKELESQTEALEDQEKNAKELYEQALEDIRNGSVELYEEMIHWNDVYGDGISDTIKDAWEEAYIALQKYYDLYGEMYNGINLGNATGYQWQNGSWNGSVISGSGAGSPPVTQTPGGFSTSPMPNPSGAPSGGSGSSTGQYGKASDTTGNIRVGSSGDDVRAIQHALNMLGYGNAGTESEDGVFGSKTKEAVIAFQRAMGLTADGVVGNNTREKFRANGYYTGTRYATPGIHAIDERGSETIFESADGTKYKMFTGGEKVLNAKASNFLYNFAMKGSDILDKIISSAMGGGMFDKLKPALVSNQIRTGDIIINGNADHQTVSEIRRAQRDAITDVLKAFNKLNK